MITVIRYIRYVELLYVPRLGFRRVCSFDPIIRSVSICNPHLLRNQLVDQLQNADHKLVPRRVESKSHTTFDVGQPGSGLEIGHS